MIAAPQIPKSELRKIERGEYRITRWTGRLNAQPTKLLTPRWYPLVPHPEQVRFVESPARFPVAWAGRRSGKTERAKRKIVRACLDAIWKRRPYRAIAAGPTRDQAKSIWWEDLKALVPEWALDKSKGRDGISESTLTIHMRNGVDLMVLGMDRPQRAAGSPIDFLILDEFGDMRPTAWNIMRPALSTLGRPGRCVFIGTPVGKNHFYEIVRDYAVPQRNGEWDYFTWTSEEIQPDDEIESAKDSLDAKSYGEQYRAEWADPTGRVAYDFTRERNCRRVEYDPTAPALDFCFDFNVSPGTCVIAQDQRTPLVVPGYAQEFSAALGEVFIADDSNTPMVVRKVLHDWGPDGAIAKHRGTVRLFGDASGGARTTQKEGQSDWRMIREMLAPVYGDRLEDHVQLKNPLVRARVNAMNSRIRSTSGVVSFVVDPIRCPNLIHDFEDLTWKDGAAEEIEKDKHPLVGHLFDCISYREWRIHAPGGGDVAFGNA